jgi:hypothetical protein
MSSERWRPVVGFPYYAVSNLGRVRNAAGRILKPWMIRGLYPEVGLRRGGKTYKRLTHRLAAEAFGYAPRGSRWEVDYKRGTVATRDSIIHGIGPTGPHSSKFKGVSRARNRWFACIEINGRTKAIGLFASERAAAKKYDAWARRLWGRSAFQNFRAEK